MTLLAQVLEEASLTLSVSGMLSGGIPNLAGRLTTIIGTLVTQSARIGPCVAATAASSALAASCLRALVVSDSSCSGSTSSGSKSPNMVSNRSINFWVLVPMQAM